MAFDCFVDKNEIMIPAKRNVRFYSMYMYIGVTFDCFMDKHDIVPMSSMRCTIVLEHWWLF